MRIFILDSLPQEPHHGKEGQKKGTLVVSWRPSVRKVTISEGRRPPNVVAEDREATVRCEVQLGGPPRSKSEVRATIGE